MIDDTQLPDLQDTQAMLENPQAAEELPAEQPQQEQAPAPQQVQQQETAPQRSFRELREQNERIARERDDMARRLKEAEMKAVESEVTIGDDDIVEGKHLKAFKKQQYQMQEQIKAYEKQLEETTLSLRIKSQYPDFDSVFTASNIEKLRNDHPEIAATLATGDKYSAAVSAYKIIKQFNLAESDPYMQEKQKAQANALKPKPTATLSPQQGGSPLERANAFEHGLTDDLRKQLLNEMKEAMKNR